MRASVMIVTAALLSVAACKPQSEAKSGDVALASATDDAAVRKAIEDANIRFLAAVEKNDSTGLLANYSDDAVVMLPNGAAMKGRAAISKGFTDMMSQVMIMSPKAFTDDVIVKDDIAIETGRYEWMVHPKAGGAAMTDKGKYMTVWKRQADGSWKIIRDINNTDLPAK